MLRILAALVLWSACSLAHAADTVQLQLRGKIGPRGAVLDIELDSVANASGARSLVRVHAFLAPQTRASDALAMLRMRLEGERWAYAHAPSSSEGLEASLVLPQVARASVRTAGGLEFTLTLCEGVPASVGVLDPLGVAQDTRLLVLGQTWNPRMRERRELVIVAPLRAADGPTGSAQALLTATGKAQWISESPSRETWRPVASKEGTELSGLSFQFQREPDAAPGDWGLELVLK